MLGREHLLYPVPDPTPGVGDLLYPVPDPTPGVEVHDSTWQTSGKRPPRLTRWHEPLCALRRRGSSASMICVPIFQAIPGRWLGIYLGHCPHKRECKKLSSPWKGSGVVVEKKLSPYHYRVRLKAVISVVNHDRKKAVSCPKGPRLDSDEWIWVKFAL